MSGALDSFRLDGQLAVVTGASRGIGAAIALGLAEAGADIVGVARTMDADGGELGAAVRRLGRRFTGIGADLATRDGVRGAVDELEAIDRPVDVLVNNAGIIERAPAIEHDDEQWDRVIAVNLTAPFLLARSVGSRMVARGQGRIVFLASMMSYLGGRDVVSYAASKTGVMGLVRALANEWAEHGVGVNAIAPGFVETEITVGRFGDPGRVAQFLPRLPIGRTAQPTDVVGAVLLLASPAGAYLHGVTIPVDGGWLVR